MADSPALKLAHVRPVRPADFPSAEPWEEHLGQSQRHLELCFLLFALLKRLVTPEHSCGSDQFVYWNARSNRRQLAPDGYVKLGVPHEAVNSWKTWEKGIPELAVEILSPSDTPERWTFEEKLERYHELGVRELVCFDVDGRAGERLRVWDLIQGDLVERVVEGESTPCLVLSHALGASMAWTVAPFAGFPAALRLTRDGALVATAEEERDATAQERDATAHQRDAAAKERDEAVQQRDTAEREASALAARVAELEAKLNGR